MKVTIDREALERLLEASLKVVQGPFPVPIGMLSDLIEAIAPVQVEMNQRYAKERFSGTSETKAMPGSDSEMPPQCPHGFLEACCVLCQDIEDGLCPTCGDSGDCPRCHDDHVYEAADRRRKWLKEEGVE